MKFITEEMGRSELDAALISAARCILTGFVCLIKEHFLGHAAIIKWNSLDDLHFKLASDLLSPHILLHTWASAKLSILIS